MGVGLGAAVVLGAVAGGAMAQVDVGASLPGGGSVSVDTDSDGGSVSVDTGSGGGSASVDTGSGSASVSGGTGSTKVSGSTGTGSGSTGTGSGSTGTGSGSTGTGSGSTGTGSGSTGTGSGSTSTGSGSTSTGSGTVTTLAPGFAPAAGQFRLLGPSAPPATAANLLVPFPVVLIEGSYTRRGVRVRRLTVLAPPGATTRISCIGRRCPRRGMRQGATAAAGPLRAVRFRRFQRRFSAGVSIAIYVTKAGKIGKYTRFRVRKAKPPTRTDACVRGTARRPSPCPTS